MIQNLILGLDCSLNQTVHPWIMSRLDHSLLGPDYQPKCVPFQSVRMTNRIEEVLTTQGGSTITSQCVALLVGVWWHGQFSNEKYR